MYGSEDQLTAKNFFDLPEFPLGGAGSLIGEAFGFHIAVIGGGAGNFLHFAFGLTASALRSVM